MSLYHSDPKNQPVMPRKKTPKKIVTILRHSCLTGKVVWMYRGKGTKAAVRKAYQRACQREIATVTHWAEMVEAYRSRVTKFLNDCLANIPITETLTPEQKAGVREVQKIIKEECKPYTAFYDHIMEERRRRAEDREIRRQMREREEQRKREETENDDYDK